MEQKPLEQQAQVTDFVTPAEVMASDVSESIRILDAEIARLDYELANVYVGKEFIDPMADGMKAEQLSVRLADMRMQRAQLEPVKMSPQDSAHLN